jgi:predicted enzyme related to lactoylglutathione lyase
MTARHHTFDYIELAAPDLAAAKSFYADAFGWTFTDYGPDYAGIHRPDGDGEMGGDDRAEATLNAKHSAVE